MKRKEGFQGERAVILPASLTAEAEHDPFRRHLHITDIGYYPKAEDHYRSREKGINQHILIYCVEGKGWFQLNGQQHHVGKDQFFILPAGLPHAYGADPRAPWTIYWVHFKGEVAGTFTEGLQVPTDILPGNDSRICERIGTFEEIFNTLKNGYSKENLDYATSCFYYFLGSFKFMGKYRDSGKNKEHEKNTVERAIHYMRENIEKKLSLADISNYLCYSPSHFSAIFNKRTGYSPLSYYLQLKIQQACYYLDFTDMKINQICHKIGIDDPYYFSRLFTKQMGLSPTDYRKHKKG